MPRETEWEGGWSSPFCACFVEGGGLCLVRLSPYVSFKLGCSRHFSERVISPDTRPEQQFKFSTLQVKLALVCTGVQDGRKDTAHRMPGGQESVGRTGHVVASSCREHPSLNVRAPACFHFNSCLRANKQTQKGHVHMVKENRHHMSYV